MSNWLYWRLRRLVGEGKVLIRDGKAFRGLTPEDVATSTDVDPNADGTLDLGDASFRWRSLRLATSLILSASGTVVVGANTLIGSVADKLNAAHLAIASQAIGDLLVASSTTAFTRLPDVAVNQVLASGGVGAAPAYSATPTVTSLTCTGDLAAAGGFRQWLPAGWAFAAIASGDNATPASSTPVAGEFKLGPSFRAPRAGSITALTFQIDTDPAGSAIVVAVTVNGTVVAGTATTLAAGATRYVTAVFSKDAHAFVAGDVIGLAVRTGSGWSATSAEAAGAVEVES